MTFRAIYTVLKTLGMDKLTAFDLAYNKYGENNIMGYTGQMKWDSFKNKEIPIYFSEK